MGGGFLKRTRRRPWRSSRNDSERTTERCAVRAESTAVLDVDVWLVSPSTTSTCARY